MVSLKGSAHAVIVTAVLLVFGGTACGGGSEHSASSSVLGRAFQSKAEAVCAGVLAQKKAQGPFPFPDFNPTDPDISKLPAIARIETTTVKIYEGWLSDLQALGQPPSGRAGWSDVVEAVRTNGRIIADQQMAAARRDGERFTKDYYTGTKAQHEIERASNAVGLPGCANASAA